MKNEFDMTDFRKMRYYLGLEVLQKYTSIFISQKKYDVLGCKLMKDEDGINVDKLTICVTTQEKEKKNKNKEKKKRKKKTQSPENSRVFRRPPSFTDPTRNDSHTSLHLQPTTPRIDQSTCKQRK